MAWRIKPEKMRFDRAVAGSLSQTCTGLATTQMRAISSPVQNVRDPLNCGHSALGSDALSLSSLTSLTSLSSQRLWQSLTSAATSHAPLLAQLDRAPGFEPGGWGFKSLGAGHISRTELLNLLRVRGWLLPCDQNGIVRPNAPPVKPAGVEAVPCPASANPHRHSATSTALRK